MYLLPLFKSLMHEVPTYMTEGGWGCIYVLCGGIEVLVLFKQRFPQQPHAPLVPLSKLRDKEPQFPLIFMHTLTYTYACALLTVTSARAYLYALDSNITAKYDKVNLLTDRKETLKHSQQGIDRK